MSRRAAVAVLGVLLALAGVTVGGDRPAPGGYEALPQDLAERAAALRDRALEGTKAYDFVRDLVVEVGPRFAGTEGDRRAVAWAEKRLRDLGFENVRAEEVMVPRWIRGTARAEITAPYPQPMVVAALGGSVATPPGGLEAAVVEAGSLDELNAFERERVAGKIVFLNRRMERARDGSNYGRTVPIRVVGAAAAARLGAVAVVIRSVGTSNNRVAHTGTMRYLPELPKIPAAALSNPDADLLEAQLERGGEVRLELELTSRYDGQAPSANVIGEVTGSERPREVVLLAAHLDSWDLGPGAIDDGSGCAIVTEAARLIAALPERPKRTVRVLLTANEEFGLSGANAYAERHFDELENHVLATEADFGAGKVWAMRSRVAEPALAWARDLARLLEPLGIEYQGNEARGGADLRPLHPHRVPLLDLRQDGTRYFDVHHTANDTLDKIDPEALDQNVAAYAIAAYLAAEYDGDLRPAPEFPPRPGR